jgi:hypothetical protein
MGAGSAAEITHQSRLALEPGCKSCEENEASAKTPANWDSGFFMERTDPKRVKASRLEGGKLPRFKRRPFDQAALRAWKEIGYTNDAAHIREHLGILWEKRKVKR